MVPARVGSSPSKIMELSSPNAGMRFRTMAAQPASTAEITVL